MLGYLPADKWEREVYNQLKAQLPADWLVVANVTWSRRAVSEDRRWVRDGEADFVVLAPSLGMAVLEVKGSKAFRVDPNGRWYRSDPARGIEAELPEPPPLQATRNMHEIQDAIVQRCRWVNFPGLFGYLVIYPQGRLEGELPAMYDSSTIVAASQLRQLEPKIRAALLARGDQAWGAHFTRAFAEQAAGVLVNQSFRITKADTPLEVGEESDRIDELSRQQYAALHGIFAHPRVAVLGPAGSGKTVLAMWRLAALIEQGSRAIYVCYNKVLAEALRRAHPAQAGSIVNVDKLFWDIAHDARLNPDATLRGTHDHTEFFRSSLPSLVMDAYAGQREDTKYDAIIVDEGQDFGQLQLIALLELLKQQGTYAFFADWRQDIFRAAAGGAVGAEVVFSLHHNCRNTSRINSATNRLLGGSIAAMPGVPEGVDPIITCCTSPETMAARAWELAREWHSKPGDVAILSPFTVDGSSMAGSRIGHGLRLVTDLDSWSDVGAVYFSTIKSFKGIEARSVIVVDVGTPGSHPAFSDEDLYVACTRPTTRLALITRHQQAFQWASERLRTNQAR